MFNARSYLNVSKEVQLAKVKFREEAKINGSYFNERASEDKTLDKQKRQSFLQGYFTNLNLPYSFKA